MAKEQALQFIIRVNEEPALQDQVNAVTSEGIDGLIRIGRANGFEFTAEEFQTAAFESWEAQQSASISEDDLETIVGGAESAKKYKPNLFSPFIGGSQFLNGPGINLQGTAEKW